MRKIEKVIITLVAVMIFCTCTQTLEAASQKQILKNVIANFKSGNLSAAESYNKQLSDKISEKCVKKISKKVKSAYLKKAKEILKKKEYGYCVFTDVDNNKTPDMIIMSASSESDARFYFYTYKKGKLKLWGTASAWHSSLHGYPDTNGVVVSVGVNGTQELKQFYIKNGKLKSKSLAYRMVSDYLLLGLNFKSVYSFYK